MDGLFPFQRRDIVATSSFTTVTTTSAATFTTIQISTALCMEIANPSATVGAAFAFTPFGKTAVTAITASRIIPPLGVLYERLPQGCEGVSAIALSTGGQTLVFTPGVVNG